MLTILPDLPNLSNIKYHSISHYMNEGIDKKAKCVYYTPILIYTFYTEVIYCRGRKNRDAKEETYRFSYRPRLR